MKFVYLTLLGLLLLSYQSVGKKSRREADFNDNDFAEFEDFEEDDAEVAVDDDVESDEAPQPQVQQATQDAQDDEDEDEGTVEVKINSDSQTKMPEVKPTIVFCFNVAGKGKTKTSDMENMKPLMQLVFYCIDKVARVSLSKEGKQKAEKNRQKAEEVFLKSAHAQRQEAAQLRREEKHRVEKERIMNEEDPDKARKWEERQNKQDMKRKQPKTKMMKVKGM